MQKSSTNNERNVYLIQIHPRQTDQSPYQIKKKMDFPVRKRKFPDFETCIYTTACILKYKLEYINQIT